MTLTSFEARRILGVGSSATQEEIKTAYRRLTSKHHPDKGGNADEFKKIKAAYEKLSSSGGSSSFRSGTRTDEDTGWDAYDKYNTNASTTSKVKVRVTVKEAFDGVENCKLAVSNKDGSLDDSFQLSIQIKPGVINGETLHVQKIDGITYVFIAEVSPPPINLEADNASEYTVNWNAGTPDFGNLYLKKAINPVTMMGGGWVKIECPLDSGEVSVRIVPGTRSNSKLKIKGKGYWQNRSVNQRADIILEVVADIRHIERYANSDKEEMIAQLLVSVDAESAAKIIRNIIRNLVDNLPAKTAMDLVCNILDLVDLDKDKNCDPRN